MSKIIEQAKEIRRQTIEAARALPDEQALNSILLFDEWSSFIGRSAAVKQRVRYNGELYECVQAHTPQTDWMPSATPSLWKRISIEEWPQWKQPLGGHDAYKIGDKVMYGGKKWTSTAKDNIWVPGVYGWNEVKN